jgi:hypothetical protein
MTQLPPKGSLEPPARLLVFPMRDLSERVEYRGDRKFIHLLRFGREADAESSTSHVLSEPTTEP